MAKYSFLKSLRTHLATLPALLPPQKKESRAGLLPLPRMFSPISSPAEAFAVPFRVRSVWGHPRSVLPKFMELCMGAPCFFCLSISKRDLNTKKTPPNIEVCPERLRSMLEY